MTVRSECDVIITTLTTDPKHIERERELFRLDFYQHEEEKKLIGVLSWLGLAMEACIVIGVVIDIWFRRQENYLPNGDRRW